jgi:hypothetical protein
MRRACERPRSNFASVAYAVQIKTMSAKRVPRLPICNARHRGYGSIARPSSVPGWAGEHIGCAPFPVKCSLEPMTADECQRRADEAKTLAAQTQDLWERETLLRIATQWQLIASHRTAKENKPTS